jgi:hypothetical protein
MVDSKPIQKAATTRIRRCLKNLRRNPAVIDLSDWKQSRAGKGVIDLSDWKQSRAGKGKTLHHPFLNLIFSGLK